MQIENHGIATAGVVDVLQALLRHRDELALVAGGAAGLSIPAHHVGPQDASLAVSHTVDVGLEVVVAGDAGGGGELLVGVYVAEMVAVAPFRGAAGLNEACQDTALQRFGLGGIAFDLAIASLEDGS